MVSREQLVPNRRLPALYLAFAHASMLLAVAVVAFDPVPLTGFLYHAPIPRAVRLHIGLACVNFVVAGILGLLIGVDRDIDVVPGSTIANVHAHAHLAGFGWATLMVVGVGYRALPVVLPSAMPEGLRVITSLVLVQLGVMGVCATLLMTGESEPRVDRLRRGGGRDVAERCGLDGSPPSESAASSTPA